MNVHVGLGRFAVEVLSSTTEEPAMHISRHALLSQASHLGAALPCRSELLHRIAELRNACRPAEGEHSQGGLDHEEEGEEEEGEAEP